MFLHLRTIVLLVLASLPVNAATVTGVIITKEAARSRSNNMHSYCCDPMIELLRSDEGRDSVLACFVLAFLPVNAAPKAS